MNSIENIRIAHEPNIMPPPELMREEGIDVLEEWFRWAEEWSMLLKVYAKITRNSAVLEIGCGLGRIAFPLRYVLLNGSYEGFEICRHKVDFLQKNFQPAYPNFNFTWANVKNTFYNPHGKFEASGYRFPYDNNAFDIVFAASVFTHMLPGNTVNYFKESARVLKPDGLCLFSFFLVDYYHPGQPRPLGFSRSAFNFDHSCEGYNKEFAIAVPDNPEQMTAYSLSLVERFALEAGLKFVCPPLPGLWSGSTISWVGMQDLIILKKSETSMADQYPGAENKKL